MKQTVRPAPRLEGEVKLPGDKSISQRAILLNSIANARRTCPTSARETTAPPYSAA